MLAFSLKEKTKPNQSLLPFKEPTPPLPALSGVAEWERSMLYFAGEADLEASERKGVKSLYPSRSLLLCNGCPLDLC